MDKTKYGKYIIEDFNGRPMNDVRSQDAFQKVLSQVAKPILYLDNNMIDGGFYSEVMWFHTASDVQVEAHTHDFNEILAFIGSDPRDYHDLCGEIEFWLDDEKHILTKSCMVFIPAGLKHSPMVLRRIDKPICHFSIGQGKVYDKTIK
jgi:hypothetical protein